MAAVSISNLVMHKKLKRTHVHRTSTDRITEFNASARGIKQFGKTPEILAGFRFGNIVGYRPVAK
jgi:hypothetical protein